MLEKGTSFEYPVASGVPANPALPALDTLQAPAEGDAKAFLRDHEDHVNHLVYEAVATFGGSFSAEHGIGALKADKLAKYQSPVALTMMRAVKQALDPEGLMNPRCMLP